VVTSVELAWDSLLEADLEQLRTVLQPLSLPAGARVFEQGEIGDRMLLIADGEVRSSVRLPDGSERTLSCSGPGEVVGEVGLVTAARRSATVTAITPLQGWTLDRHGFDVLRWDPRPTAVTVLRRLVAVTVARLRDRCTEDHHRFEDRFSPAAPERFTVHRVPRLPLEYLASLLCFEKFPALEDVESTVRDVPVRTADRGEVLIEEGTSPPSLLLVVRGAVEVTIHHGRSLRRVRLAGPGRFVGHNGVLDEQPSPVAARARERSVLLAFPRETIRMSLVDPERPARAFSAALLEDAARALREASRPMALTAERRSPR